MKTVGPWRSFGSNLPPPPPPNHRDPFKFICRELLFRIIQVPLGKWNSSHPSGPNFPNTATYPLWLASQIIRIPRCTWKRRSSSMLATSPCKLSNAAWHSVVHINSIFWFYKGRKVAKVSASAGNYLCKVFMEPIYDFSCDNFRGGFSILIGSVFRTNGRCLFFKLIFVLDDLAATNFALCRKNNHVFSAKLLCCDILEDVIQNLL